MKKIFVIFLALIILVCIGVGGTAIAGKQDFTLVNKTGVTIYNLYISPAFSEDWEEDVLEDSLLYNNDSIRINFQGRYETYWDIMIKDKYGNERIWEDLDLSRILKITLYINGNDVWADIDRY